MPAQTATKAKQQNKKSQANNVQPTPRAPAKKLNTLCVDKPAPSCADHSNALDLINLESYMVNIFKPKQAVAGNKTTAPTPDDVVTKTTQPSRAEKRRRQRQRRRNNAAAPLVAAAVNNANQQTQAASTGPVVVHTCQTRDEAHLQQFNQDFPTQRKLQASTSSHCVIANISIAPTADSSKNEVDNCTEETSITTGWMLPRQQRKLNARQQRAQEKRRERNNNNKDASTQTEFKRLAGIRDAFTGDAQDLRSISVGKASHGWTHGLHNFIGRPTSRVMLSELKSMQN